MIQMKEIILWIKTEINNRKIKYITWSLILNYFLRWELDSSGKSKTSKIYIKELLIQWKNKQSYILRKYSGDKSSFTFSK